LHDIVEEEEESMQTGAAFMYSYDLSSKDEGSTSNEGWIA
jgi:hypothetical protein